MEINPLFDLSGKKPLLYNQTTYNHKSYYDSDLSSRTSP